MSIGAPHKFKAQLFKVYAEAQLPGCEVNIMDKWDDSLNVVVELDKENQHWCSQFKFDDDTIPDKPYDEMLGWEHLSGKYNGVNETSTMPHIYDRTDEHITFAEFVKLFGEMKVLVEKLTKGISKIKYLYPHCGFTIQYDSIIQLNVSPLEGFRLYYDPKYKGVKPQLHADLLSGYLVANQIEYIIDPDAVIEKVRKIVLELKAFDKKYKDAIKKRMGELEADTQALVTEFKGRNVL
jgi:hypothetical protein